MIRVETKRPVEAWITDPARPQDPPTHLKSFEVWVHGAPGTTMNVLAVNAVDAIERAARRHRWDSLRGEDVELCARVAGDGSYIEKAVRLS